MPSSDIEVDESRSIAGRSRRATRREDTDVDGMIDDLWTELRTAAQKFLVSTPALMQHQDKLRKQRQKRAEKRKTDISAAPTQKKAKKKKQPEPESDDEVVLVAVPAVVTISYYIEILKKALVMKGRSAKAVLDDTPQRGPFTLPFDADYPTFLSNITAALPCQVDHINQSKIEWKTKKPIKGKILPLGKATGYKAMLAELSEKKQDARTVILFMPAPVEPVEDEVPWDADAAIEPKFDYSELESRGFYFDLTSLRIGVWSAAIAQNLTNEKTPPAYRLFDAQQRIKTVPPALPPAAVAPVALALAPAPLPAAPPAPVLSLSKILLASLLSNGGGFPGLMNPLLNGGSIGPTAAAPCAIRSAPPSPVKRHTVTVDRFREFYRIDEVRRHSDCKRAGERHNSGPNPLTGRSDASEITVDLHSGSIPGNRLFTRPRGANRRLATSGVVKFSL
ncbi:hypothetical protein B0H13DRAFT_2318853 [Mycena leptocephala]|nr:hypothetical protein B0H13DRAFT_2318853 [Mycena leptocephala]